MRSVLVSILLAGSLMGCSATTRAPAPILPAGPGANAGPPAPVQDAPANLPDRFEVATVDPTWSVRVEGSAPVVLDGPDGQQRVLRVEMQQAVFDGRYVQARDATGMVEIRITPRLCLDRASTQYPYTARLTLEGMAPMLGCGRPLP
jgi:uncharacterized membrane protein